MSDLLQKQRRQKIMRDLEGRESIDELSYWNQREDFSVFEKPEEQPSFEENKLAALNYMIKKKALPQ